MARSAFASERAAAFTVGIAAFVLPLVACRAFVDLEGLGDGNAAAADATPGDATVASDGAVDSDAGNVVVDASADVATDVDAGKPCPGTGGPLAVRVPAGSTSFCIDTTEVTREQYQAFLVNLPSTANQGAFCAWNTTFDPQGIPWPPAAGDLKKPIGGVDWCDALGFCKWAGKRLCGQVGGGVLAPANALSTTLSEYMVACTASGARVYPYGNTYDEAKCNGGSSTLEDVAARPECQTNGVYDLAGNVHEWFDACAVVGAPESDPCATQLSAFDGHPMGDMECAKAEGVPRNGTSGAIGFRCCSD